MSACKYWDCGWCYAPNYLKTNAINSTCVDPNKCPISLLSKLVQYETPMTEIEELKAQIKVLEKKLSFLEELEKTKSPVEEAFKDNYGVYPNELKTTDDFNCWKSFKRGYVAAQKDYKVGEYQETVQERGERLHKDVERVVKESVKWCEEHPDEDPLDYVKPQTPIPKMELLKDGSVYCVDYNNTTYYRQHYRHSDGWIKWWRQNDDGTQLTRVDDRETFRLLEQLFAADISANPQGSLKFTFGPTLYDVIEDWWSDIFTTGVDGDSDTCIKDLVERIWKWMPSYQSAAGSQSIGVEELVEGWNDCLDTIRRKLG